jgi:hypothetical protein
MAVGKVNIGKTEFTFVFRHRFEWPKDDFEWNKWSLGVWFRKTKTIGRRNFYKPSLWKVNLVNHYMCGIDLIICRMWFTITRNGMSFPDL